MSREYCADLDSDRSLDPEREQWNRQREIELAKRINERDDGTDQLGEYSWKHLTEQT